MFCLSSCLPVSWHFVLGFSIFCPSASMPCLNSNPLVVLILQCLKVFPEYFAMIEAPCPTASALFHLTPLAHLPQHFDVSTTCFHQGFKVCEIMLLSFALKFSKSVDFLKILFAANSPSLSQGPSYSHCTAHSFKQSAMTKKKERKTSYTSKLIRGDTWAIGKKR